MRRRTPQTFVARPLRLLTVAMTLAAGLAVGTAMLTAPSHAHAQPYDDGKPGYGPGADDPDYADADLNRDIAAGNAAEEARGDANNRAYSDAQERYAEAVNQRLNDEVRAEAQYNRRVQDWRRAVARCNAGDHAYCDNNEPRR